MRRTMGEGMQNLSCLVFGMRVHVFQLFWGASLTDTTIFLFANNSGGITMSGNRMGGIEQQLKKSTTLKQKNIALWIRC